MDDQRDWQSGGRGEAEVVPVNFPLASGLSVVLDSEHRELQAKDTSNIS